MILLFFYMMFQLCHFHIRFVLSQDQVSYLTSEYEDAVQRSRRLSASREKILTGRGNLTNLLTQDDVVIYLRWLVCHLHSVQTIHNFLRVKITDSFKVAVYDIQGVWCLIKLKLF